MPDLTLKTRYSNRAKHCFNSNAKILLKIIEDKQSPLAFSADLTNSQELLDLVDAVGSEICLLKTHIDIIEDYTLELNIKLCALAKKHRFLIFEDRKFADIGNTVKQQYAGGIYKIAQWADLINAHALPGPGIIEGLKSIGNPLGRGLLLLAEMSSKGALTDALYARKTLEMALNHTDFVIGFIAQHRFDPDPRFLYLTPGIQLEKGSDHLGQQYLTPELAIKENGSDIIIVGRGITSAKDPQSTAQEYRQRAWAAAMAHDMGKII